MINDDQRQPQSVVNVGFYKQMICLLLKHQCEYQCEYMSSIDVYVKWHHSIVLLPISLRIRMPTLIQVLIHSAKILHFPASSPIACGRVIKLWTMRHAKVVCGISKKDA